VFAALDLKVACSVSASLFQFALLGRHGAATEINRRRRNFQDTNIFIGIFPILMNAEIGSDFVLKIRIM
jgi:hypothetical protein